MEIRTIVTNQPDYGGPLMSVCKTADSDLQIGECHPKTTVRIQLSVVRNLCGKDFPSSTASPETGMGREGVP